MTTSILITLAGLLVFGGLLAIVIKLAKHKGAADVAKKISQEADDARKVRDEVEFETRALSDAELAKRMSEWTSKN